MRQLHRMAGEQAEQWQRTGALCRLFDAMHEAFGWPSTASERHHNDGGRGNNTNDGRMSPAPGGRTSPRIDDGSGGGGGGGSGALSSRGGGGSGGGRRYSDALLAVLWGMAMDVFKSAIDTPAGVLRPHFRYVVHSLSLIHI